MTTRSRFDACLKELQELERTLLERLTTIKDRRRAEDVRLLHSVRASLDPINAYASQAGQDRIIDQLFERKTNGTFIDVGGYDGVTGSNSFFFERVRGWTGLLVEPVEDFRKQAEKQRDCPCLPLAVSDKNGEAAFMAVTSGYTQMSGLVENYDQDMLARVRDNRRHAEEEVRVQTRTLSGLLNEHDLLHPDFISLDIEGGELSVLTSFPFDDHQVGTWSIENNDASPKLGQIMRANGYKLVEYCGPDEVYAHSSIL